MSIETALPIQIKADLAQDLGLTIETLPANLDPIQTAKAIAVKPDTLAVWRCNGRYPDLPFTKIGRSVRYRTTDVVNFILSHRYQHNGVAA